jgi:hypothetical protein
MDMKREVIENSYFIRKRLLNSKKQLREMDIQLFLCNSISMTEILQNFKSALHEEKTSMTNAKT